MNLLRNGGIYAAAIEAVMRQLQDEPWIAEAAAVVAFNQFVDWLDVGIHQMCTLILPVRLITHPSGHDSEANAPTSVANVGEGTSCISMVAEGERMLLFVDDSAGTEGLASGRDGWRRCGR